MWIGATYYDGQLPLKGPDETWRDFGLHLIDLLYEGAFPTAKAWAVYWTFFFLEALMYVEPYFTTFTRQLQDPKADPPKAVASAWFSAKPLESF